jgi:hypothetical protein
VPAAGHFPSGPPADQTRAPCSRPSIQLPICARRDAPRSAPLRPHAAARPTPDAPPAQSGYDSAPCKDAFSTFSNALCNAGQFKSYFDQSLDAQCTSWARTVTGATPGSGRRRLLL